VKANTGYRSFPYLNNQVLFALFYWSWLMAEGIWLGGKSGF